MKPPSALALKGASVEEWTDVHFFRPVGIRIARALAPAGVTADQVTLAGLLVGLVGGHLLLYRGVGIDLAGVALLVVADLFDSADGQLARLTGTSTRLGRVLDGVSDMVRFLNLYAHLLVRMVRDQGASPWPALILVLVVVWSHSLQGATVDFIKNVFLEIGTGRGGEVDLPEDLDAGGAGVGLPRIARRLYRGYVREQVMLFPATCRLLRSVRHAAPDPGFGERYAARQAGLLPVLTLIATNIRFALLALFVLAGHVMWLLYATVVPMNLVMLSVMVVHEGRAVGLLRSFAAPTEVPAGAD